MSSAKIKVSRPIMLAWRDLVSLILIGRMPGHRGKLKVSREVCAAYLRRTMKKDNKQVMNALVLVFQFGINMVVPIFLCCIIGIWIGDKTGISWMMIPFFFIGALAGFTNIYKMARKLIEKDSKDNRYVKKDK